MELDLTWSTRLRKVIYLTSRVESTLLKRTGLAKTVRVICLVGVSAASSTVGGGATYNGAAHTTGERNRIPNKRKEQEPV